MTTITCDRCGDVKTDNRYTEVRSLVIGWGTLELRPPTDLCKRCVTELSDWLNTKVARR